MFHYCSGILLVKSFSFWSANMFVPGNKLLEGGFITKQDLTPVINSPVKYFGQTPLWVYFGFFAGLYDLNPSSLHSWRETVLTLISVSFLRRYARTFLQELVRDRPTILFIALSSREAVFCGLPLFIRLPYIPSELNFLITFEQMIC